MPVNGSVMRKQTFKKKLQGFDQAEVTRFIDAVASDVDRLLAENADLLKKVTELETQLADFRSVEKALQQTLQQAQDSTAMAIDQARKEAQRMIQEAELKGAQIVEKSRGDLTTLKEQVTILAAKKESIVGRLKMLLHSELELVKSLESGDEPVRPQAEEPPPREAGRSSEIDDIVRSLDEP